MGPYNGVFCVHDYFDDFFLWNPATKEIKELPKSCIPPPPDLKIASDKFEFGFDPKTNDYKVIRLGQLSVVDQEESSDDYHTIKLYKLSTNSWRKFDGRIVPVVTCIFEGTWPGMYLNGIYHWSAQSKGKNFIISLDMGEEVFQVTPLPKELWYTLLWRIFRVWNESLGMICCSMDESPEKCIQVWKMSEYGRKANWTLQLTIGHVARIEFPMGLWKNNHEFILGDYHGQVVSYNPKTGTRKVLIPINKFAATFGDPCPNMAVMYKESLVSVTRLTQIP